MTTRRSTTKATVAATNAQKPGSAMSGTLTVETVEPTTSVKLATVAIAPSVLPRMSGRFTLSAEVLAVDGISTVCELSAELSSEAEAVRHWLPMVAKTAKAAMMATSHAKRLLPTVWAISLLLKRCPFVGFWPTLGTLPKQRRQQSVREALQSVCLRPFGRSLCSSGAPFVGYGLS